MHLEARGAIALVTLARPETGNTMDLDLLTALGDRLDDAAAAPWARALVLTGAGRAFSLGGDVGGFGGLLDAGEDVAVEHLGRSIDALARAIGLLRASPVPTVAAIGGQAAGAGLSLALACDFRVMSARAALNVAYGALGASPDGGMTWLLPRLVGPARAVQLLIEQPVIRAERALAERLVDDVVPRDEALDAALARAAKLAALAPHVVRAARALVDRAHTVTLADQMACERDWFEAGVRTLDLQRAVRAMGRGERPDFSPPAQRSRGGPC